MVTNPISANQVTSVQLNDWKCLDVPCKTLPNTLQAIVDKVCDTPDFTTLDFGCVESSTTLLGTLQNTLGTINSLVCEDSGAPTETNGSTLLVDRITACSSDNWSCAEPDACFDLTNSCDPGLITVGLLFQKLIDRNVAYGNVIKSLCTKISDLEAVVAAQQVAINLVQVNCCSENPVM